MKQNYSYFFICLLMMACNPKNKTVEQASNELNPTVATVNQNFAFTEFFPDSLSNAKLADFSIRSAYLLDSNQLIVASHWTKDGSIEAPDTETDYGARLMLLSKDNKQLFASHGFMDLFLVEPHFYKNDQDQRIIILCQTAFEYFSGAELFIYENNSLKHLGNLDLSGKDMDTSLVDIVRVNQQADSLLFTFDSDSLLLNPGGNEEMVKNNNMHYLYKDGVLTFNR
ncbi:hypothetical protein [Sphingobacterium hungaricum]